MSSRLYIFYHWSLLWPASSSALGSLLEAAPLLPQKRTAWSQLLHSNCQHVGLRHRELGEGPSHVLLGESWHTVVIKQLTSSSLLLPVKKMPATFCLYSSWAHTGMRSALEKAGKGWGIWKAKDMKLRKGYMQGLWVKKQNNQKITALEKGKGTSIQSATELTHL